MMWRSTRMKHEQKLHEQNRLRLIWPFPISTTKLIPMNSLQSNDNNNFIQTGQVDRVVMWMSAAGYFLNHLEINVPLFEFLIPGERWRHAKFSPWNFSPKFYVSLDIYVVNINIYTTLNFFPSLVFTILFCRKKKCFCVLEERNLHS